MSKLIDLTGRKFGRLSVICRYDVNDKLGRAFWKCQCDCGKFSTALGYNLRTGHTTSCGCFHLEKQSTQHKRPHEVQYKGLCRNAKTHKETNDLITYEDFLEFVKIVNCHYCGDRILWNRRSNKQVRSTAYNLDRKDSIKGYTKENCVVCCKRCNRAKSNLFSYEEWLEIGKFIQEHPENFKRLQ